MFAQEFSYKCFIRGTICCVSYLCIIGFLSLCFSGKLHVLFMHFLDYSSVVVAGVYFVAVICFVMTCIQYNTPQNMVATIEQQYFKGEKLLTRYLRRLERQERKNEKEKSESKRRFKAMKLSFGRSVAYSTREEARIIRFLDLGKYTLRKQDYGLFLSVINRVDKIVKEDKCDSGMKNERWTSMFYEEIVESYLYCPQNSKIEDTLMMYWFSAFNHSREPNKRTIYRMLGKMVSAVRQGRLSIFEQYVRFANYGYSFIKALQRVSFVRGETIEMQKKIDQNQQVFWHELCEMHYIALAHLFSNGCYEAIKIVFSGNNTGYRCLFPNSGAEILNLYSRCKGKQDVLGRYSGYLYLKEVVGENVDSEMLEKFTSFILLVVSDASSLSLNMTSTTGLQLLHNTKAALNRFAKVWQDSAELCSLFPQIRNVHFEKRLNTCIDKLSTTVFNERKVNDGGLFDKPICALWEVLGKACKNSNESDSYQRIIPERIQEELTNQFGKILYGNRDYLVDGLTSENDSYKSERILMGELYILIHGQSLMDLNALYMSRVFNDIMDIFRSRYLFMVCSAISRMELTDISKPIDQFESSFDEYVGGRGTEYMIIDFGSSMNLFYEFDKPGNGYGSPIHRKFKGAIYKSIDLNVGLYSKDIELLEPFKETCVIIKRSDLPAIISNSKSLPKGPDIEFVGESGRDKGDTIVSAVVDSKYEIRYSKSVKVVRLRLERMKRI